MAVNGILLDDAEIENDGASFDVVPIGEHNFEVMSFTRKRGPFTFNDKATKVKSTVPDCPYREVALKLFDDDGHDLGGVNEKLYLHTEAEWKLCQFFTAIGMRKHGERLKMNWEAAAHKTGRLKIKHTVRPSTKDATKTVTFANVEKFLEPPQAAAQGNDDNPL